MHFPIFLCDASMRCWNYSFGMPLGSVVTAFWIASMPSKRVLLMISLSLGKRNVIPSKINWIGKLLQYGNVPLGHELPDAQHTKVPYFSDMPKTSLIIIQTVFFFMSSWLASIQSQPTITTHHPSYLLDVDLGPSCWRLLAPLVIFHFFQDPLWTSCATQKHVCPTCSYRYPLAEAYQGLLTVFLDRAKNFSFIRSSVLCWTT